MIEWQPYEQIGFQAVISINCGDDRGPGEYWIIIYPRPHYCDRGDWQIFVEGHNNDLDGADGFPRYFFGDESQVKEQMQTWLNKREAYRNTL